MTDTSIRVSKALADELYRRKGRATSYEDYIWQLLDEPESAERSVQNDEQSRPPVSAPKHDVDGLDAPVSESDYEQLRDELAGSGDLLDRRVDAILTMYGVLREFGEAEKDDMLDTVDVDSTGYASKNSVWSNMVKGKQSLQALPGVEKPPTGRTVWRYNP